MRAEHSHLQPSQVELRRGWCRAVEPANVAAVIGHTAHAIRQRTANAGGESFPIALRIDTPLDGIALAARPAGAAQHHRRAVFRASELFRRLVDAAVIEQRIDVVQATALIAVEGNRIVGHLLTEVAVDYVDANFEQGLVGIAPPCTRGRTGEVDDATFW